MTDNDITNYNIINNLANLTKFINFSSIYISFGWEHIEFNKFYSSNDFSKVSKKLIKNIWFNKDVDHFTISGFLLMNDQLHNHFVNFLNLKYQQQNLWLISGNRY